MTATLKADNKGRYALGRFLPRKPQGRMILLDTSTIVAWLDSNHEHHDSSVGCL